MNVSLQADYAFRVVMYLSLNGQELVQTASISKAHGISAAHLIKVVQKLTKCGYVQTVRGRNGGLRLLLAPERINLGRLFRQMEPSLNLLECFDREKNSCPIVGSCALRGIFHDARQAFLDVLDQATLADAVGDRLKMKRTMNVV